MPWPYVALGRETREAGTLQGAAFEGRKFGILEFALQHVGVSLYLFFDLSNTLRMVVAGWRGGTTDLCPGRQKHRAATAWALEYAIRETVDRYGQK